MSIISEKVSYLKGLAEGLKINENSGEGKLLSEIINILGEIANDIEYLDDSQDEIFDRVYDLEDEVYGEDFDEEYDEDFDFFNDDEEDRFSIKCPSCSENFFVDMSNLEDDEDIVCPNCKETIELEFDCDCDCDDCSDC